MVGESIENYRIDEILGHGGMGVVYKAMDTSIDRTVALKVMNTSYAADEEFLWRFKSEAKVLGRLQHQNIVNVYAFRHIEPHLFIVMEYVNGGTLSGLIDRSGVVPVEKALPILKQSLSALQFAHSSNIIHRDIKPHNILLTKAGQVKISDFGLAKIQENTATTMTRVGVTGGTIYYMPPEQSVALKDVDQRGDIYSLGMTMYQMLTGRMPFDEGSSTLTILKAIDEQRIPPPNTFNPAMPAPLVNIIMRAIQKDRNERFQSAAEMLDALEAFEKGEAAQPAPEGTRIYTAPERTMLHTAVATDRPAKSEKPKPRPEKPKPSGPAAPRTTSKKGRYAGVAVILLLVIAGIFALGGDDDATLPETSSTPATSDLNDPPPNQGGTQATLLAESEDPSNTEETPPPAENGVAVPESPPAESNTPAYAQNPGASTSANVHSIRIASTPSGARILLDGRPAGTTPQNLSQLAARRYAIELQREGYQTWQGTFDPSRQAQLSPSLAALEGKVRVVVRPYGNILINGQSHAENTNAAYETALPAGPHVIRVMHPVLGSWEKTVRIAAGQTEDLLFNFNQEFDVTVISDPINAEIFIDGASTGRYTPSQFKLRPGNHTIAVQKPDYTAVDGTMNILLENQLSSPIEFKLEANQ